MSDKKHSFDKLAGIWLIFLVASYCVFFVMNLWTEGFDSELFVKVSVTYGVLVGFSVVAYLIKREFFENKKLKDENYID